MTPKKLLPKKLPKKQAPKKEAPKKEAPKKQPPKLMFSELNIKPDPKDSSFMQAFCCVRGYWAQATMMSEQECNYMISVIKGGNYKKGESTTIWNHRMYKNLRTEGDFDSTKFSWVDYVILYSIYNNQLPKPFKNWVKAVRHTTRVTDDSQAYFEIYKDCGEEHHRLFELCWPKGPLSAKSRSSSDEEDDADDTDDQQDGKDDDELQILYTGPREVTSYDGELKRKRIQDVEDSDVEFISSGPRKPRQIDETQSDEDLEGERLQGLKTTLQAVSRQQSMEDMTMEDMKNSRGYRNNWWNYHKRQLNDAEMRWVMERLERERNGAYTMLSEADFLLFDFNMKDIDLVEPPDLIEPLSVDSDVIKKPDDIIATLRKHKASGDEHQADRDKLDKEMLRNMGLVAKGVAKLEAKKTS